MPNKLLLFKNCQGDLFLQRPGDTIVLAKLSLVLLVFKHLSLKRMYGKGWLESGLGRALCRNCLRSRQWMFQVDQLSSSDVGALPMPEEYTGSGL